MVDGTNEVFVDDDDTLLSLVEKAEMDALLCKRKMMDGRPSDLISEKRVKVDYVEAPKGSKNHQWQKQLPNNSIPFQSIQQETAKSSVTGNEVLRGVEAGGSGSGPCFKCGKLGHWARDCNALAGGGGGGGSREGAERENNDPSLVEKPCPCGLGTCLVLTAYTEKNRGRKFYRCPVREENGGCSFFEWCDHSLKAPVSSGSQIKPTSSPFPDLQCPCGAGRCFILTAKTEKHAGQQFYRCPSNQGCGFFKWCSENAPTAGLPMSSSLVNTSLNDTSSKSQHVRSSSSCFKCGQEGHWARDCPKPPVDSSTEVGKRFGSSSTCFKCSKPGHWARDCPS